MTIAQLNWPEINQESRDLTSDLPHSRICVSVIVLAYKHEMYISQCLDGIMSQQGEFDLDVIVAEDCSPDRTLDIASGYAEKYPSKVRVLSSDKNLGMMKNMERAIHHAKGQFVAFCEGDDYWIDPSKVRLQIAELLNNEDIDICFHSTFHQSADTNKISGPHARRGRGTVRTSLKDSILIGRFMPTASVVVRNSFCQSLPQWLFDEAPIGDMYIYILGSKRGGAIYIDRPMSVYRTGVPSGWGSSMKNFDRLMEFEQKYILCMSYLERDIGLGRDVFDLKMFKAYSGACLNATVDRRADLVRYTLSVLHKRGFRKMRYRLALRLLGVAPVRVPVAWVRAAMISARYRMSVLVNALTLNAIGGR